MEKIIELENNIKIVEYDNSYAKSIAKMWIMSSDSWAGGNAVQTEESIIAENENSDNINIYLAVDGEEVVGYCSFSEYHEDEGALYIPLLNVRSDYHGKKIGKALVLQAVKRTIELGWPRLDLYTWPGNTKAVPLYKKCGFFWEKKDEATHLMNFIPTVINTEAVKEYFEEIDWYNDSKRVIEVKPDGDEEYDFGNYEYLWEKDNKRLRMEFERKGRGLRLIETDDYLIEAKVENQKLIFGNKYQVSYRIVNKTEKPLEISLKGFNDKNIKFEMNVNINVKEEEKITGLFEVEEIKEEQSQWRTHPTVATEVTINGKKAILKIGIEPKFPAKIDIVVPDVEKYNNIQNKCYLNIENNFNEEAEFQFELPNSKDVEFISSKFTIKMKAKERKSIPVSYMLKNSCIYSKDIDINIKLENKTIKFSRRLSSVIKGINGKFSGETDEDWLICNGRYTLKLSKFNNEIIVNNYTKNYSNRFVFYPKLGMPLSSEFSKKKPYEVKYQIVGDEIVLRAYYKSEDFKDIQLTSILALSQDGMVKHSYEINNLSEKRTNNEMWISTGVFHNFAHGFIPYEGKIIDIKGDHGGDLDFWERSKFTENWFFCKDDNETKGLCWSKDSKLKLNGWHLAIEDNLGYIEGKDKVITKPIIMTTDTYNDWKDFRAFALKNNDDKDFDITDKFEILINEGNPFVKDKVNIKIKNYHNIDFNGDISVNSKKYSFDTIKKSFSRDEKVRQCNFEIPIDKIAPLEILDFDMDFDDIAFKRQSATLKVGDNEVIKENLIDEGMDNYIINNGVIKFKVAPEFGNAMYSLTHKGIEWLDSSYPTPIPKSWWNPWIGGMSSRPKIMKADSVLNEERDGEFVELKDNFDNTWHGIKLSLKVTNHDKYKGLELSEYFVTLPEVPIVLTMIEIEQETGVYFDSEDFFTDIFIKPNEELKDNWFVCKNGNNDLVKYKGGKLSDIKDGLFIAFEGKNIEDKMFIYHTGKENLLGFSNNLTMGSLVFNKISCESGKKVLTKPTILFFNDEYVGEKLIKDLKNIKFDI